MLQLLAAQEPTALILEDLHWAEPTLLELIAYIIATDDTESRLAIVCSTRPELAETSPGFLGTDGRGGRSSSAPSTREQAAALLTDLLGDPALVETPFASSLISNAGEIRSSSRRRCGCCATAVSSTRSVGAARRWASYRCRRASRA